MSFELWLVSPGDAKVWDPTHDGEAVMNGPPGGLGLRSESNRDCKRRFASGMTNKGDQAAVTSGVEDFAFAFEDAAYDVVALVHAVEDGFCFSEEIGGDDSHHADAHVEGAKHFVLLYRTQLL